MSEQYIPKVGDVREFNLIGIGWTKCSVEAETRRFVIIDAGGVEHHCLKDRIESRPIKTEADCYRENVIAEMIDLVDFKDVNSFNQELLKICEITCEQLFDAGYHNGPKFGDRARYCDLMLEASPSQASSNVRISLDELYRKFDIFRKISD